MRVPVLIAGGGTVGLATALFLSHHGVRSIVVERQDGPSIHPRATGIGPRTAEFFREVGIEATVNAAAIDMTARRLGKAGGPTLATVDWARAAPGPPQQPASPFGSLGPSHLRGTCPQDRVDAILLSEATRRGADVRYSTRLLSFEQTATGEIGRAHV